jgi:hypothetical protein
MKPYLGLLRVVGEVELTRHGPHRRYGIEAEEAPQAGPIATQQRHHTGVAFLTWRGGGRELAKVER